MRTGEDFRREFPAMDDDFKSAAQSALDSLTEEERGQHALRWTAVLAALMVLLATAALAAGIARWTASDFIDASRYASNTPQSEAVLAASVVDVPIEVPWARMRLRQAVYDGMAVYLLFEAVPAQEGFMVAMGAERLEGDQAFSHGSGYPTDVGIREYATEQGYSGVELLEVFAGETTGSLFDSAVNEDGTFSLMVWSFVKPEYRGLPEITLNLRVQDASESVVTSELPRIPVTLQLAGEISTSTCDCVTPIPAAGLTVTGVTVHRTAMTSYILVDYEVMDASVYSRSLFYSGGIILTDAQGCALPRGTHPLSLVVDRAMQGMGEGPYYITNRLLLQDVQEIILQVADQRYIFPLQ